MLVFRYVARDYSGDIKEGVTKAASESDVLSWLQGQDYTPISVEIVSIGTRKKLHIPAFQRIRSSELAAVFWQMTTMVEGGITIVEALDAIAEDIDNARLQKVLETILERVERGESVSESMVDYPNVFNKLVCSLIMAGETGGNISVAFRRVAEYYTNRDRLARKIKKAMAYPAFVFGFVIVVVAVIMTLVIPRFTDLFDRFGAGQLPAFTQAFMGVYNVIYSNMVYILGGLLLFVILYVVLYKYSPTFHSICSRLFLRVPLFGKLIKQAFIASFCKTMSNLLRGGVPVLEAFEILSEMTKNDVICNALEKTRENIVSGTSIFLSMATSKFFPNMVIKMVRAGEESGSLWKTLDRTADFYEDKVDATITTITSLLEPLLIIIVGIIVLIVVLALYLPIFQISDIRSGV
ncbi:MAG: type II secretion system F family protein [Sedimentisphaerales bacterium]|nr:type II secretion system F family protein [Sedimentisphaerales bacterium]